MLTSLAQRQTRGSIGSALFWIVSHRVCVGSRRVHRSSGERGVSLRVPWYLSNHD